jgi:exodeoxyribonuclease VII small subunit
MSEAQPPVPSTGKRSSKRAAEASDPTGRPISKNNNDDEWIATVAGLNYSQARTSMDLAIAQLQSEDLEVEQMATLYRNALACADRCEQLLAAVELEVVHLDPANLRPTNSHGESE